MGQQQWLSGQSQSQTRPWRGGGAWCAQAPPASFTCSVDVYSYRCTGRWRNGQGNTLSEGVAGFPSFLFWLISLGLMFFSLVDSLATLKASSAVFRICGTLGFFKFYSRITFFKKCLSVFLFSFPFLNFKIIFKESWLLQVLSNVAINFLICL